ncbi:MAG: glycosyltransferase family 2 protein [Clostridia bacterium]|nr:glycosyltransferase family 2 protein [Clostridia bacterium]
MPKISVIVPVYKVEKYIHRCIDSILNQTFSDFELILVDDGSPDNCGRICDEYAECDDRIKVIHKENGGLSDARNAGIDWAFKNSGSEWLTFIDSDDWVHEKYLELLFAAASENGVSLSSCGHKPLKDISETENIIENDDVIIDSPENMFQKGLEYTEYNFTTAWGRLYKKDLFEKIRYPKGRLHEDELTTYKLIYQCDKIAVIKAPLYYYFQNAEGIMSQKDSPAKMSDRLTGVLEQIDFFYKNGFPVSFGVAIKHYAFLIKEYLPSGSAKKQLSKASSFEKEYGDYLPQEFKKYGYKKYLTGKAFKIENFKNDIKNVKRDKGSIFAALWALKNYWKI